MRNIQDLLRRIIHSMGRDNFKPPGCMPFRRELSPLPADVSDGCDYWMLVANVREVLKGGIGGKNHGSNPQKPWLEVVGLQHPSYDLLTRRSQRTSKLGGG